MSINEVLYSYSEAIAKAESDIKAEHEKLQKHFKERDMANYVISLLPLQEKRYVKNWRLAQQRAYELSNEEKNDDNNKELLELYIEQTRFWSEKVIKARCNISDFNKFLLKNNVETICDDMLAQDHYSLQQKLFELNLLVQEKEDGRIKEQMIIFKQDISKERQEIDKRQDELDKMYQERQPENQEKVA